MNMPNTATTFARIPMDTKEYPGMSLASMVSFRKLSKGVRATGGIWILSGGMMVIDVTKFHKGYKIGR